MGFSMCDFRSAVGSGLEEGMAKQGIPKEVIELVSKEIKERFDKMPLDSLREFLCER